MFTKVTLAFFSNTGCEERRSQTVTLPDVIQITGDRADVMFKTIKNPPRLPFDYVLFGVSIRSANGSSTWRQDS
jgi:hypothetical protein